MDNLQAFLRCNEHTLQWEVAWGSTSPWTHDDALQRKDEKSSSTGRDRSNAAWTKMEKS